MSTELLIKKMKIEKDELLCRTCLATTNLKSLFSKIKCLEQSILLRSMLMACTSIKVLKNDGLPNRICNKCIKLMTQAYIFKQKCEQTQAVLRSCIDLLKLKQSNESKLDILLSDDETHDILQCQVDTVKNECENNFVSSQSNETVVLKSESMDINLDNDNVFSEDTINRKANANNNLTSNKVKCNLGSIKSIELKKKRYVSNKDHKCKFCSKSFTNSQLIVHMRIHTQEKPYKCNICRLKFTQNSNLQRHLMTHTGERPHRCHLCNKGFIQKLALIAHLGSHSNEHPYVCSVCGKSFKTYAYFKIHLKKHTESEKNITKEHTCDICNRSYISKHVLKVHRLSHGDKTFLCSECGKGFVNRAYLLSHVKVHTGEKPYSCDTCGKSFSQVGTLKSHKLIHTGERPFVCNVCNKAFTQRTHLKYHTRVHSGERPYKCSVCHKSFSLNGTLTVHMRIHTGETPYVCSICGKGFHDGSSMKKHYRSHNDK